MIVGVLFMLVCVFIFAVQIALMLSAFSTSTKLGIMAFFVPMYLTSVGNHRLRTPHRRRLAAAWWIGLLLLVVLAAVYPR